MKSVRILHEHGVLFSEKKGKTRRETPYKYLEEQGQVPQNLKHIILTETIQPGIKLWARIDYLINFKGYRLIDERLSEVELEARRKRRKARKCNK